MSIVLQIFISPIVGLKSMSKLNGLSAIFRKITIVFE